MLTKPQARLLGDFVSCSLPLDEAETREFYRIIDEDFTPDERDKVRAMFNEWVEEGRLIGLAEGARSYVLGKLHRRLGEASADVERNVRQLPPDALEQFDDAMGGFREAADVARWFAARP